MVGVLEYFQYIMDNEEVEYPDNADEAILLFSYLIEKAGEVDGWMLHDMDGIICECVTWHWPVYEYEYDTACMIWVWYHLHYIYSKERMLIKLAPYTF